MDRISSELRHGPYGPFVQKPGMKGSDASYRMGKNKSLELAFIDEKLVDAFAGEVIKPSEEAKQLIDNIFGERIKNWTEGNLVVGKNLIQSIYSQCLDDGVSVEHSYVDVNGKEYTEPGHAILNRKAMITELKTRIGFKFNKETQDYKVDKKFKILNLDLSRFREADLQGAGDYDLNIFTRQLNLAVGQIVKQCKIDPKDIILGRYGGDEFSIAIIENTKDGQVNSFDFSEEIKKIIIETAQSAEGFFGNNEQSNFEIKDATKVDYIDLDKMNAKSRMIYLNSLDEALILGTSELKDELIYVQESMKDMKENKLETTDDREKLLKFLGHNDSSTYPDDLIENKDSKTIIQNKMKYLIKGHDEMSLPFIFAEDLDSRDGGKRTEQLLDFYQGYLIDPLLKDISMSRSDIFGHIKRGEFTNIYAFEIKMKEINDHLSYVYGDNTIKKFWNENFKNLLRPLIENGKIKIGRVGGMLVVCETGKDGGLNNEERKLLKDPISIESKYKGKNEKHEIGFAQIEVPKDVGTNSESFKKVVEDMFNKPTEDWLRKTFQRIIYNYEEFAEFIRILKREQIKSTSQITLISAKYFDSKRAARRIPTAQDILDKLGSQNLNEVAQMRVDSIAQELNKILKQF